MVPRACKYYRVRDNKRLLFCFFSRSINNGTSRTAWFARTARSDVDYSSPPCPVGFKIHLKRRRRRWCSRRASFMNVPCRLRKSVLADFSVCLSNRIKICRFRPTRRPFQFRLTFGSDTKRCQWVYCSQERSAQGNGQTYKLYTRQCKRLDM